MKPGEAARQCLRFSLGIEQDLAQVQSVVRELQCIIHTLQG